MTAPTKKRTYLPWFILIFAIATGVAMCRPSKLSSSVDDTMPKTYEPITYDVASWQIHGMHLKPNDSDAIKSLLGSSVTTEDALDYDGRVAQKYRYTAQYEPPLYIIESDALMELVWYYADAKDGENFKASSIEYAQKAYRVAHALYGDDSTGLIQAMLDGKPTTKQTGLMVATCQDYHCRLIWQK